MNLVELFTEHDFSGSPPPGQAYITTYQWNKDTKVVDTVGPNLDDITAIPEYDKPTTEIVDQYWDGTNFKRIFHNGFGTTTSSTIASPNVYDSHQSNIQIAQPINVTPYYDVSNKGSIDVRSVGGIAPIEFDLDGGTPQSSGLFTDLNAGTYTITATDVNGFTDTVDVTIATFTAYGDWKTTDFKDYLGRDVEITIQRQGYTGSVTEMCFAGNPLNLIAENTGNETSGLVFITASLNLIETVNGEFDSLINSDIGEFCLKYKITDPSTVFETYLQYDPEDVTVTHLDPNKEISVKFKTDLIDSEDTIEDFSGYITPIKLLSHFFTPRDTFKKTFETVTSLWETNDPSTYSYQTLGKYPFDASICNGLTQRDVVNMLCDTYNITIYSGAAHYIYNSNLISVDATKTGTIYDNIGESTSNPSNTPDLRSIVNPTAGTLNYINRSQQYRFNKQLKSVELTQSIPNKQELTTLSPIWEDTTLTNYTNPSSITVNKLRDRDGNKINDGVEIVGVTEFVKDAEFIKSEPVYLSEGNSTVLLEIKVEVPGSNPSQSVDIVTSFSAQLLYGDNSMTDLTQFDLDYGSFITKEITKTDTEVTIKAKNTLPAGANYLTVVLYQLQDTSTSGYTATKVKVNSVKVEVLPSNKYYDEEQSYTEVVNDKGVTESIALKLGDSFGVDNAPAIFGGALLRDNLSKTSEWQGEGVTGAKPIIEALGELKSLYKPSKIKILSCTLIDDPPKWNTTYTDPTIPGAYFRVLPNWQYDIKMNQLQCELIEIIISTASLGDRLLETADNRLLETGDLRQLE